MYGIENVKSRHKIIIDRQIIFYYILHRNFKWRVDGTT